jgi:hypothetical protein
MRVKKLPILLSVIGFVLGCCISFSVDAQTPETINSVATIISDMEPPHQGFPHGVPKNYDWANSPKIGMGNNPKNFKAMTAWGQLYESDNGNPATNTRVQIRNIKAYMLSKQDNKWHLLQSSTGMQGSAFREDFAGNANKAPDVRVEKDGSISATAGGGDNYHFWTATGRASIDPNDLGGIFTTVQARLIVDNPKEKDDRDQASYVLNMAGDYWLNLDAGWDNFKTNGDIGMGKFKYLAKNWQAFNMTTVSPDQIRQNPPPIE